MSPAELEIRTRIGKQGRITFAEFMEIALYHPTGGYYAEGAGAEDDYFTSPAAHPVFGALIALQFKRMWEVMGRPVRFHVVEMGAGAGVLARDVIEFAANLPGEFARSLRYIGLERRGPAGRSEASTVSWQSVVATADSLPVSGVAGCFFSNELIDAFPAHRFRLQQGNLAEIYVALDEQSRFVEILDEPSTPLLGRRLEAMEQPRPDDLQGEVRLNLEPWLKQVSDALTRGFVVTVDYGHEGGDLYSNIRRGGTLRTYYRHTEGGDPYQHIGRQDITAHVDFTALASTGSKLGLTPVALLSQADFLGALGHQRMVERVRAMNVSHRERDANMMGMNQLVSLEGLGAFKVLIQQRGTGVTDVAQLAPVAEPTAPEVPLLGSGHFQLAEGRYPHLAWEHEDLWPFGKSGR